jgi:cytosine/adenosine deaminase-related metal-dependent hydrolase
MDAEAHYYASLSNMIELLYSGCTTTADMMYIFPKKFNHLELFGATVNAAKKCGIRFHPFRGSMSVSRKDGGLFGDDVVESHHQITERTEETIREFHDNSADAMVKVGIAPCTVFTSTKDDYLSAAEVAQKYQTVLQTHLSESLYEQEYIKAKYHQTPLSYLSSLGWNNNKVSFAHCIELTKQDINLIAQQHNSVCHCPISNARSALGQNGIAPITEMINEKINISIGVDGSAGNDSSNMLEEMRWARTIQGARENSTYLSAEEVIYMGTMGGAIALSRQDMIGSIEIGKCADIAIFDVKDSVSKIY